MDSRSPGGDSLRADLTMVEEFEGEKAKGKVCAFTPTFPFQR